MKSGILDNPTVRQILYVATLVSALALAVTEFAMAAHLLSDEAGGPLVNFLTKVVAIVAPLGGGTAATYLGKQMRGGTLDFSGTPAEQMLAAAKAIIEQAKTNAASVDQVREMLSGVPVVSDVIDAVGQITDEHGHGDGR